MCVCVVCVYIFSGSVIHPVSNWRAKKSCDGCRPLVERVNLFCSMGLGEGLRVVSFAVVLDVGCDNKWGCMRLFFLLCRQSLRSKKRNKVLYSKLTFFCCHTTKTGFF